MPVNHIPGQSRSSGPNILYYITIVYYYCTVLFVYTWDRSCVAFVPCFVVRSPSQHLFLWRLGEGNTTTAAAVVDADRGGSAQWSGLPRFVFSNQSYTHVFRHARFSRARARQASTATCYCTIAQLLHVPLQSSGVKLLRRTSIPFCNFLCTRPDNISIIIIKYCAYRPTERWCAYTRIV